MKKLFTVALTFLLMLTMCSQEPPKVKLEQGSEAYQLAASLADSLPVLNPDENNVLVTTDNFRISTGELIKTMQANFGDRMSQLKSANGEQLRNVLQQNVIQLGEKKMLLDAANQANVTVPQSAVDSVFDAQFKRAGGEAQFKEQVESMGVTMDHLEEEFRKGLKINKYLEEALAGKMEVTEDEILAEYNSDKSADVRHILFSTQGLSEGEKTATKDSALQVLERAKNGADFATLAEVYSDDPGSKNNGGLYEDIEKGQMVKPFEDAAFSIPEGDVGDELVETRYGYHIIKVVDRTAEQKELSAVRPQIEQRLRQQKQSEVYQNHIDSLKSVIHFEVKEF